MFAFLLAFGLVALFIVGGMMASLRLRIPSMPMERRLSGLRRSYAAPTNYTTTERSSTSEDEMSRYTRKTFVISILILVILSVIIINALSSVVH